MARRGTRKRRSSRRSGLMTGVVGAVVGVLGYIVFDAVIHPFIPVNSMVLAFGELALGAFLATRRNGFLKHFGMAMLIIEAFVLTKTFVSPALSGLIPTMTA